MQKVDGHKLQRIFYFRKCLLFLIGWAGTLPVSVGFGRDIVTGAYKVILMYLFAKGDNILKTEVLNLQSGERHYICFPLTYNELGNDKLSVFANG